MQTEGFPEGEIVIREYKTLEGSIEVSGEVVIENDGKTLHMSNIGIFPANIRRLNVGNRELLNIRNRLATEVKAAGFEQLRITGRRVSGATFDGTLSSGRSIEKLLE